MRYCNRFRIHRDALCLIAGTREKRMLPDRREFAPSRTWTGRLFSVYCAAVVGNPGSDSHRRCAMFEIVHCFRMEIRA